MLREVSRGSSLLWCNSRTFANRIKDGKYQLDGKTFQLETNEPPTLQHLHGGSKGGFDKYVWHHSVEQTDNGVFVHFSRISPDGESGYGGTLTVTHTIGLDEDNQVHYNLRPRQTSQRLSTLLTIATTT